MGKFYVMSHTMYYLIIILVVLSNVERPISTTTTSGQPVCVVCGDIANGVHFGAVTCEGCKVLQYQLSILYC